MRDFNTPNGADLNFSIHYRKALLPTRFCHPKGHSHSFMGHNLLKVWSAIKLEPVVVPVVCIMVPVAACGALVFACLFKILWTWDLLEMKCRKKIFGDWTWEGFRKSRREQGYKT